MSVESAVDALSRHSSLDTRHSPFRIFRVLLLLISILLGWELNSRPLFALELYSRAATQYPPPRIDLYQPNPRRPVHVRRFDVVVVGATPGGCAAAITAARLGRSVALIEPSSHIGGMIAGGLSRTDFGTTLSRGGIFHEFAGRILDYYKEAYGEDSQQVRDSRQGYYFEPKVARATLAQMIDDVPISIFLQNELVAANKRGNRVVSILTRDLPRALRNQIYGSVFIDATYEGDLAAAAGAAYRIGREDKTEFGETHAGEIFWDTVKYGIVFGSGKGNRKIQAYNYRIILTRRSDLRVPIEKPSQYDRERYVTIIPDVLVGWHKNWFTIMSILPIPNGKWDANNHPKGVPSTDLIEGADAYPEADYEERKRIAEEHRQHILGLLYFLQNDEALPESFRNASREWGLCSDEFTDTDHVSPQLYVREARRIAGRYLLTENDILTEGQEKRGPVGSRPTIHKDSIAVGDYPTDSHATTKVDPAMPRIVEGFFYTSVNPYQIPYRIMLPLGIEGLIVSVAMSSTHVGYGTLRLEPVWMAVGQSAGMAADLAIVRKTVPSRIGIEQLQLRLLREKQVLTLFTDVPLDHPSFESLQFWGARGFFPTYEAMPDAPATRATTARWLWTVLQLLNPSLDYTVSTKGFNDVGPTHADYPVIHSLASHGVIAADQMFRPDDPIVSGDLSSWLKQMGRVRKSAPPPQNLTGESPDSALSRGQVCDILLRFYMNMRMNR